MFNVGCGYSSVVLANCGKLFFLKDIYMELYFGATMYINSNANPLLKANQKSSYKFEKDACDFPQ